MNIGSIVSAAALAIMSTGCGIIPGLGSGDYERGQTRGEQSVRMGVVDSVRSVRIEGTHSGVGAGAGAVVGGVAGSAIGDGKGQAVATVVGAIAGGVAGAAVEQQATKKQGIEITVRLDSGNMIAVTQEVEKEQTFAAGDRVRVLSGGGVTRVTH